MQLFSIETGDQDYVRISKCFLVVIFYTVCQTISDLVYIIQVYMCV